MSSVWETLGVPRGSDRDAIRRGYARLLKTVHPEDDPEGFKALREAYDRALQEADWAARYGDEDDPEGGDDDEDAYDQDWGKDVAQEAFAGDEAEGRGPIWRTHDTAPAPLAARDGAADDAFAAQEARESAELDTLMHNLAERLHSEAELDPDGLVRAFEAIVASPVMGNISASAGVEAWLAGAIADTIPRSDPLIVPAIQAFGWNGGDYRLANDWTIGRIMGRIDEWDFAAAATERGSDVWVGWRALTRRPLPGWRMRLLGWSATRRTQVAALLDRAEYDMPGLGHYFTPERVAWFRAFAARAHHTWSTLLLAPLVLWLVATVVVALTNNDDTIGYAMLLGTPLALAVPTLWVRLVKRRQLGWFSGDLDAPPRWFSNGWMPAAAAWPLVAMLLPGNAAGVAIAIALSAVLVLWTTVAQPPAPLTDNLATRTFNFLSALLLPFFLVISQALQDQQRFVMWLAVAIATGTAWLRGRQRLAYMLPELVARLRVPATYWAIPALIGVALLVHVVLPGTPLTYTAGLAVVLGIPVLKLLWDVEPQATGVVTVAMWIALAVFYVAVIPPLPDTREKGASPEAALAVCPPDTRTELGPPVPCGSPASWFTADDYPDEAVRKEATGTTAYDLYVDQTGAVIDCTVTQSSGSPTLDETTCTVLRERARFLPARDAVGPIAANWANRTVWRLTD